MRKNTGHPGIRAFTLVESLVAMAILAVAVIGVMQAIAAGQQQTYAALDSVRAQAVGETLLEEVVAKPYLALSGGNALGPEAGEVRATFNSADDYHNYNETAGNLRDCAGTLLPSVYQGYSRQVTCSYATLVVASTGASVDGMYATVTVTENGQTVGSYTRFITP